MSGNSMQMSVPEKIEPSALVIQFSELCRDIMIKVYDVKNSNFLGRVKHALKDIRNFKYDVMNRHDICFHENISYKEPVVRCAYLYAYGILNMIIVYFEFFKLLERVQKLCRQTFSKKTLKICCLAGGPGIEAVAVSKAIRDIASKYFSEAEFFTDVEVTVIDIISEWKSEGESAFSSLNGSSNIFGTTKVNFQYSFVKADLLSEFEDVLKENIADADIITIIKFGSAIAERSESSNFIEQLENTIKNVIDCMQEKSCLFMLDLAGGNTFKQLSYVIANQENKFNLSRSLHKKYSLLPKTLQKMEAYINFQNFADISTFFPTKLTTVSSCLWIKKSLGRSHKNKSKGTAKANTKMNANPSA